MTSIRKFKDFSRVSRVGTKFKDFSRFQGSVGTLYTYVWGMEYNELIICLWVWALLDILRGWSRLYVIFIVDVYLAIGLLETFYHIWTLSNPVQGNLLRCRHWYANISLASLSANSAIASLRKEGGSSLKRFLGSNGCLCHCLPLSVVAWVDDP